MWHIWRSARIITYFLCSARRRHGNCCMFGSEPLKRGESIASSQELAYIQCNHGGELKWAVWQHTRFQRTKMWATNVGCRACLASFTISQQPLPRLPAKPTRPRWDGKEDLNKERDLFFSELPCSNDITSAASSPRFQTPSTFFFCSSLSQASILTEFLHFIIALPPLCHETLAPTKPGFVFHSESTAEIAHYS